jgi:hypothetical protein
VKCIFYQDGWEVRYDSGILLPKLFVRHARGPPLAWHFNTPDAWMAFSEADRIQRGELSFDQCIIDRRSFLIHGLVALPINGREGPFALGF